MSEETLYLRKREGSKSKWCDCRARLRIDGPASGCQQIGVPCVATKREKGRRWRSDPSEKCSQERLTRGTVIGTMRERQHILLDVQGVVLALVVRQ